MSVARTVSSVAQCHIICTLTVAQVMSLSLHPHGHGHLSVSPHFDSPFLFPALPYAPFLLPPALEVCRQPVHSAQREYPSPQGTHKSKGGGKISIPFCAYGETIETFFRTIISVNQLSIYGTAADLCEEYGTCQTRTGRPVLAGQSDPLFEPATLLIMIPRPSIEILLQKHKERVERLSE